MKKITTIIISFFFLSLTTILPTSLVHAQDSLFGTQGISDPGNNFFKGEDSKEDLNALTNLEFLVSQIIGILTVTAGLFFIVYFVIGAFRWVTAGGDSGAVGKARDQMLQATIGLVLVVLSYSIVGLIGSVVGLNILNPAVVLQERLGLYQAQ